VKNPTGEGLSLGASLSSAFSMSAWLWYSINQGLWVSLVSSVLLVTYYIALLIVCATRGGTRDGLKPFYLLLAAVGTSALIGGPSALAVVLGLAPLAETPQIGKALRGDVPALSTLAYALVILRTLPWLPYAMEQGDRALSLWVVTCTSVNGVMFVVLAVTRRTRAQQRG
jgi:hypothetical protein